MSAAVSSSLGPNDRDNEAWVRELADDGPSGESAQRELRRVLVSGLKRVLSSRGVGDDLCEDLAQETLLRIRLRLATFQGTSRFTTWALAIAMRVAFDELRHQRWKDISFEAASAGAQEPLSFEPATEAAPEKALQRERVVSVLRYCIEEKLSDRQRRVLVAELNGMPQGEIARLLGMKRNALYKLSHDARQRVKFHLEAAGIVEDDVLWVFQ
jgi:RNA polymerase sigma-70 factor (ECF subfamily)